jgi:hypothetical protein
MSDNAEGREMARRALSTAGALPLLAELERGWARCDSESGIAGRQARQPEARRPRRSLRESAADAGAVPSRPGRYWCIGCQALVPMGEWDGHRSHDPRQQG